MNEKLGYPASGKAANITAWVLQGLLALAFLAAGSVKLAGVPMMVEEFGVIGLGQGFRYVTGCVEIIGAIALLAPGITVLGGLWLAATMVGATIAHLGPLNSTPAPALVLLALCLIVTWLRRAQFATLVAKLRG